ncbi:hypothetical protein Y1Q_0014520 [Alligator mississippiensis]|uniref:Uncharacterized protein n=1 Tax=Alligator mississippiensis TaxID=8496 RepID=A0A151PCZ8_ALLMI|nr:hypothetical protein Y1Q_0014520 [Alligator mississippiensis]
MSCYLKEPETCMRTASEPEKCLAEFLLSWACRLLARKVNAGTGSILNASSPYNSALGSRDWSLTAALSDVTSVTIAILAIGSTTVLK